VARIIKQATAPRGAENRWDMTRRCGRSGGIPPKASLTHSVHTAHRVEMRGRFRAQRTRYRAAAVTGYSTPQKTN
jgi:hypothetical protein